MTRRANASGETARLHSSDVRYEAAPVEEDAVLSKFARAAWYCEDRRRPITLTAQVVGILIVKEGLIVAFIVDAFLSQFEDNRALCEDENIASLDQSRAGEGFRIIASKRSSKDDIYRAMFLEDDD